MKLLILCAIGMALLMVCVGISYHRRQEETKDLRNVVRRYQEGHNVHIQTVIMDESGGVEVVYDMLSERWNSGLRIEAQPGCQIMSVDISL